MPGPGFPTAWRGANWKVAGSAFYRASALAGAAGGYAEARLVACAELGAGAVQGGAGRCRAGRGGGHCPSLPTSPIVRVSHCSRPLVCLPLPPHPVHSPTRYTLPPEDGCRGHHPAYGRPRVCAPHHPATALPVARRRRTHTHSHTHTLAHSGTAPSRQAHTHHTLVESHRGATPAQPAYCST